MRLLLLPVRMAMMNLSDRILAYWPFSLPFPDSCSFSLHTSINDSEKEDVLPIMLGSLWVGSPGQRDDKSAFTFFQRVPSKKNRQDTMTIDAPVEEFI